MKLIENWLKIAKHSWSFWLAIITGILSAAEAILPLWMESLPRGRFAALAVATAILSAVARLIYQKTLHDDPAE